MKCCDVLHRRTLGPVREANKAEATEKETPHLIPRLCKGKAGPRKWHCGIWTTSRNAVTFTHATDKVGRVIAWLATLMYRSEVFVKGFTNSMLTRDKDSEGLLNRPRQGAFFLTHHGLRQHRAPIA